MHTSHHTSKILEVNERHNCYGFDQSLKEVETSKHPQEWFFDGDGDEPQKGRRNRVGEECKVALGWEIHQTDNR